MKKPISQSLDSWSNFWGQFSFANLFNLLAEIIVVFSDYEVFEPRTFDAYDNIKNSLELWRVEYLCGMLVSRDSEIVILIKIYNSGKETRTIIPYSYTEIVFLSFGIIVQIKTRYQYYLSLIFIVIFC